MDPRYAADLNALTGGLPTAEGAVATRDGRALLVAYDTNAMPIDPMLTAGEHTSLVNWRFYEWELGSEQPATLVESIPIDTGSVGTQEFEGRTFLARFSSDFSSTELLDLTQRPVTVTYRFSGLTSRLFRLSSEPESRMAHRLPTRVEGRSNASLPSLSLVSGLSDVAHSMYGAHPQNFEQKRCLRQAL